MHMLMVGFYISTTSEGLFLALSQEYPEPEDFQSLVRHLRDELPLELVTFKNQFAAPYVRKPYSPEDFTICDENGLLCFLSTSYQHPVGSKNPKRIGSNAFHDARNELRLEFDSKN